AVLALAVDILNDVVKPEGNPKIIKTSLFALAKTSEFFNHKLVPIKLNNSINSANLITPFIAHFKAEHYVLVTRLSQEKIYFIDEHQEEFLPLDKFQEQFSGYALIQGLSPQGTDPEMSVAVPLSEAEAKAILGARSVKSGSNKINWGKWAMQTGIMIGASMVLSGVRFGGKPGIASQNGAMVTEGTGAYSKGVYNWGKIGYQVPNMNMMGQGLMRATTSYTINRLAMNVGRIAGVKPGTMKIVASAA
ncbi:MAG TPA: hypothetical protein DCL49_10425, partial [Candidatus Omnitrophica bacterium]|nr:hypothetical protein [Candidatus Omnitrophota bacterium]